MYSVIQNEDDPFKGIIFQAFITTYYKNNYAETSLVGLELMMPNK